MGQSRSPQPVRIAVEITNTVRSATTSGIQRTTAALVAALAERTDVEVVPLVHHSLSGTLRLADGTDLARLAAHHPTGPPATITPATIAHEQRRTRRNQRIDRLRRRLPSALDERSRLGGIDWSTVDVFCDLEAGWHNPLDRATLFGRLAASGVAASAMVADIYPVRRPEWFTPEAVDRFRPWLDAVTRHAQHVFCVSAFTRDDLDRWMAEQHAASPPTTSVLHHGADERSRASEESPDASEVCPDGRFVLVVGTVEPRKNHVLALDAFDRLRPGRDDLHLVVVGKWGWGSGDIAGRLGDTPQVHWLAHADDGQLDSLYRRAELLLAPSLGEGFGLPIQEALLRGCPVVASDAGAQPEVANGSARLFTSDNVDAAIEALQVLLDDPNELALARDRAKTFSAPSWADTAADLAAACAALTMT